MTCPEDAPSDPPDVTATRSTLPRDDTLSALRHRRRRIVVRTLLERDEPVTVQSLVRRIAADEADPTAGSTVERHQRIYVSLTRVHLPLLEEHDILAYDRDWGRVERGPVLDAFEPALRAALSDDANDEDGSRHPSVGAGAATLLASGAGPLTIPGFAVVALVTAAFLLAATCSRLRRPVG